MKLPPIRNQDNPPPKKNYPILIALLGTIVILAVIGLVILLPQVIPQLSALGATATPQCTEPTLTLGTTTFRIETIARAIDGSITTPQDTPKVAYWVKGTTSNYVFVLSPTPDNQALSASLKAGDEATIIWADCTSSVFTLFPPEVGPADISTLLDQSMPGITVFIKTSSSTANLVAKGGQWEVQLAADDPSIDGGVTLLETSTSSDGKTVRVGIAITNYGSNAFSLTADNTSLIVEGTMPVSLISAEPSLPQKINPGERKIFHLTFPQPPVGTAILRIYNADLILKRP